MKCFLVVLAWSALALAGCSRGSTFGLTSANDFAYAVSCPAESQDVARRFELALDTLVKSGLRAESGGAVAPNQGTRQVRFQGKGVKAELRLMLPEQGFATINFTYSYETRDAKVRTETDRLLARLGDVLTPGRPLPASRIEPGATPPKAIPSSARI